MPTAYKNRYEAIDVPLKDGSTKTVKVNKYRLAGKDTKSGHAVNTAARKAFLDKLHDRGVDTALTIDTGEGIVRVDPRITQHEEALKKGRMDLLLTGASQTSSLLTGASGHDFTLSRAGLHRNVAVLGTSRADRIGFNWAPRFNTHVTNWNLAARLCFVGKGSPEACQAVLQLANFWGLAPADPQDYADAALGLDCNGFVGNYLFHAKNGNPWTNLGAEDHDLGPDAPLRNGYFDHYQKHEVDRWESLDPAKMYIMLEADKDSGVVINGGTEHVKDAGHIVITEPGPFSQLPGDPFRFGIHVVEATGGHSPEGLWHSYYTCKAYNKSNKVFTVSRREMDAGHTEMYVRIFAVG